MSDFADTQTRLAHLARSLHGDTAPEFLVGLLCSIASEEQIKSLVGHLETETYDRM